MYLVRHGRTAQNAARLLLGRMDVPLDELGRRQAAALAALPYLSGASRVITSPLARAYDTAAVLGPPVTVDERWIEIDYGIYDGRELAAAADLWRGWDADPEYRPAEGESLAGMGRRVRAACEDIWEEASRTDVVVVSHVSPIKAAVAWALGTAEEVQWRMFLDVASVSIIGPGRRGPTLRSFNETGHRPGA